MSRYRNITTTAADPRIRHAVQDLNERMRELDRRTPAFDLRTVADNNQRPAAEKFRGRRIFVRGQGGSDVGNAFISDGTQWIPVAGSAASFVTPALTYGTTYDPGSGSNVIRSNSRLKFPQALMSLANGATVTLTDNAIDSTLTGSLGALVLTPAAGGTLKLQGNQTTSNSSTVTIVNNVQAGGLVGLDVQMLNGPLSSQTLRGMRFNATLSAIVTSSTIVGIDVDANVTPSATSDTANILYGMRITSPTVNNATGGWTEVATLNLGGPNRFGAAAVTATIAETIVLACPTISATDQIGLYIKQQTAQQVAANRYGIKIDAQNSGTNKTAIYAPTDASVFGPITFDGGTITDAKNVVLGTGTGTQFGTGTTQKLGLWGVTPVIQPATTGTASTMVAGGGAAVDDKATFTGGLGATAYRLDDIVLGLKQCGVLKQ